MKHSFKNPRYRICFQTKNKVWIYKNSRLRNFYKIRNKFILARGRFAKRFLITKNMKWTVARRQMVPYFRKQKRFKYNYKNFFFCKQQLKNFYGGLKEYQMRNIFKKTWNKELNFRRNIFLGTLEQRLSMFIFRMRLLPTVYVCNQLVKHFGIYINDVKVTRINHRVRLGDIVSLSNAQWFIFYKFIFDRLKNRFFGQAILFWRKEFWLKKIRMFRLRQKYFIFRNILYFKKVSKLRFRCAIIKRLIMHRTHTNPWNDMRDIMQWGLYDFFVVTIYPKVRRLRKLLWRLKYWVKKNYKKVSRYFWRQLLTIRYFLIFILTRFLLNYTSWGLPVLMITNFKKLNKFYKGLLFPMHAFPEKNYITVYKDNTKLPLRRRLILTKLFDLKRVHHNDWENVTEFVDFQYYYDYNEVLSGSDLVTILMEKVTLDKEKASHKIAEDWVPRSRKAMKYMLRRHALWGLKKRLYYKKRIFKYKRFFFFWIRKLKYRRIKRRVFKHWCRKTHWYLPHYLEVDYNTLRASFIYYPEVNQVFFGFSCSFKKIISFYKERAL